MPLHSVVCLVYSQWSAESKDIMDDYSSLLTKSSNVHLCLVKPSNEYSESRPSTERACFTALWKDMTCQGLYKHSTMSPQRHWQLVSYGGVFNGNALRSVCVTLGVTGIPSNLCCFPFIAGGQCTTDRHRPTKTLSVRGEAMRDATLRTCSDQRSFPFGPCCI